MTKQNKYTIDDKRTFLSSRHIREFLLMKHNQRSRAVFGNVKILKDTPHGVTMTVNWSGTLGMNRVIDSVRQYFVLHPSIPKPDMVRYVKTREVYAKDNEVSTES